MFANDCLQERLKKEYRTANKQRDTGVDVTDDEDDSQGISKQAKAMQKLIRNREGNDVYESEDERNPYASSVSTYIETIFEFKFNILFFFQEEEEEPVVLPTATAAIQEQQQKIESKAQTTKAVAIPPRSSTASVSGSRATSPSLPPGQTGHSVVAKRATSPMIPKPKPPNTVHGGSPLGGQSSIVQSRSTSPVAADDAIKSTLKRKADHSSCPPPDSPNPDSQTPKPKRRKSTIQGTSISSSKLELMLLEWLKTMANATTRDCIHHFTPYLVDADKKAEFSAMVRKHATLKNGVLVARVGARATSSAPSPPAA